MQKTWVRLAAAGCVLVVLAMAVAALALFDKPHFGGMVGPMFVQIISAGVLVGGLLLAVAAWKLRGRWTWRKITLMAWGLIALTSPVFGFMFLLPWSVLVLSLPVVIVILVQLAAPSFNLAEP